MNQLAITAPVEGELVISKETILSGKTLPGRTVTLDNGTQTVAAADGTFSFPVTVESAFNSVTVSEYGRPPFRLRSGSPETLQFFH